MLWTAGVSSLYMATAKLGLTYAVVGQTVTLFWPPSGIALAAVLVGGRRAWPGITLGAILANLGTGVPLVTLFIIALGNTLEPLCGALLLGRLPNFSNTLDKVSDVFALVLLASVTSTLISASAGTLGLLAGGQIVLEDLGPTGLAWWLGDGLGVLLISPLLLAGVAKFRAGPQRFSSIRTLEALVLLLLLMIAGQAILGNPRFTGVGYYPVAFSMFPFAIWGGLRFGTLGAASVTFIVSLIAIRGTAQGIGPFAVNSAMVSLMRGSLFAYIMALTGLLLGAVRAEREHALTGLKRNNDALEWRVRKRTEELTQANLRLRKSMTDRQRLERDMSQISEARLKMIGQELHDGLGQQLTGIALLVSSLLQKYNTPSTWDIPAVRHIENLLGKAITMVRSLSHGLYPVVLETGGLAAALNHLAEYVRGLSGIQVAVQCAHGLQAMDKSTALNLYRIAQEAVSNALRHSEAQRIDITLAKDEERYVLSVADNGKGFGGQSPETGATLGLRSMQCRAGLIGAAIEILNNEEGGTSIRVTGPIHPEGPSVVQ